MANSALQLLGFVISLSGIAATIASIVMVEWRMEAQGKHRIYEGLWMTCSGTTERWTCDFHQTVLKLSTEVQATRAVLLLSVFLSAVAVVVSSVGMKCSHFMDDMPDSKSKTALTGGILFMSSGLLSIIITSWYVQTIVYNFNTSHRLQTNEFGHAVFVSWIGGVFTLIGGICLSCMRCCRSRASNPINSNQSLSTTKPNRNYV